jgi:molybdopterin/thiamine biosynthesis adenylyltransferase
MASKFHHETIYRGPGSIEKLATVSLTLCGAGALGSLLADNLARQGFQRLKVIDRDRIEEHNVGTQLYGEAEIGAWKVEALRSRLFRSVGIEIEAVSKELTERSARSLLKEPGIILDTFDNSAARRLVQDHSRAAGAPCLHAGLFADYGEVIWDEHYRVPQDVGGDVCDYPLARNLVLLTVAVASEVLVRYVLGGSKQNWSVTLGDFAIRQLEVS